MPILSQQMFKNKDMAKWNHRSYTSELDLFVVVVVAIFSALDFLLYPKNKKQQQQKKTNKQTKKKNKAWNSL